MVLSLAKTLSFYKRRDIQEAMVAAAKNKEVAFRFGEVFGKRPEALSYPNDVLELAKQKVTSFHCSEETWHNPLNLFTGIQKKEMDEHRIGWDLVLDIDCKLFEYSRLAAHYTILTLKQHGIDAITAKFSGNKGFHIAVPFEAFPRIVGGKPITELFPEAPRRIAAYITEQIRAPLAEAIFRLESGSLRKIMEKTNLSAGEITRYEANEFGDKIPKLNVDPFLEIDTILIAPRHLFRMPYSFHEKSELISVPVDVNNILAFERDMARPELVKVEHPFLDRNVSRAEAEFLLRNAFDFAPQKTNRLELDENLEREAGRPRRGEEYTIPEKAIGEEFFPPCIKLTFEGITDGKKRMCFALNNFLIGCGWEPDMIKARLAEWNAKNPEPLREQFLVSQIRFNKQQGKMMPPPGCNNPNYYKGIQVCKPDEFCAKIKNPLQYAKRKSEIVERYAKKEASQRGRKKRKDDSEMDGKSGAGGTVSPTEIDSGSRSVVGED